MQKQFFATTAMIAFMLLLSPVQAHKGLEDPLDEKNKIHPRPREEMIVIKETIQDFSSVSCGLTGLIAMYKLIKFQAFRPNINLNLEALG